MAERRGTYFVSDVHLGLDYNDPVEREGRFVEFLRSIPGDTAEALYMLGDIWDFWFEYRDVVPRGYVPVLAELVRLVQAGVKVYFFRGNHDMWAFGYLEELGVKVLEQPYFTDICGKVFCLGHGDGLGAVSRRYKLMKSLFGNHLAQRVFALLHPTAAFGLARLWSETKRKRRKTRYRFKGADEPLYRYADDMASRRHVDYFIFGHYHSPVDLPLTHGGRLMIMDDWLDPGTRPYLYFDGMYVLGSSSK